MRDQNLIAGPVRWSKYCNNKRCVLADWFAPRDDHGLCRLFQAFWVEQLGRCTTVMAEVSQSTEKPTGTNKVKGARQISLRLSFLRKQFSNGHFSQRKFLVRLSSYGRQACLSIRTIVSFVSSRGSILYASFHITLLSNTTEMGQTLF